MQDERKIILQMLADKKITVDEAAELLGALEGENPLPAGVERSEAAEPSSAVNLKETLRKLGEEIKGLESNIQDEATHHEAAQDEAVQDEAAQDLKDAVGRQPRRPPILDREFRDRVKQETRDWAKRKPFLEDIFDGLNFSFMDFGFGGRGYRFEEVYEGQFAEAVPVRLDLDTANGRLELKSWDGPGWKAIVKLHVRGRDEADARRRASELRRFESRDNAILFDARRIHGFNCGAGVELLLPRSHRYTLEARTANGRIDSGDVNYQGFQAKTANGRIVLEGGEADIVSVHTANGGTTIGARVRDVDAGTANGSIAVVPRGEGEIRLSLSTANGSIKVQADGAMPAGYQVEARTSFGSINLDMTDFQYDVNDQSIGRKYVRGRSRDFERKAARISVEARTANGSITVG